ncbi:hypothetical protein AWB68_05649 [Caballeronia choica]|jgi:hypothetical protein|uniref:Uncharacterized protein n=1 Tax=Caballeronia choica TaxID=326476 RepID=A0A158KEL2_9BURK|nr:hypothetical protein AWB68_05649 [Caballeronia choica]
MKPANTVGVDAQRRVVMHVPRVDFIGAGIVTPIEWQPSGFVSMAIVTCRVDEKYGNSALGRIETEADACQYAVPCGKAEAERRLLMTLIE